LVVEQDEIIINDMNMTTSFFMAYTLMNINQISCHSGSANLIMGFS